MKFPKLRKRTVYWAVLTVFALFTIHFVFQYKEHNSHRVQPIVLIPKAFPSLILNSFDTQNEELVPIKLLKNCQIIRSYHTGYEENTKLLGQEPQSNFHKFNFTVFSSMKPIGLDLKQCQLLSSSSQVEVNDAVNMDASLHDILGKLLQDIRHGKLEYLQEIAPFFLPELQLQLNLNIVDRFWYRFSGSSIWLDQYDMYFMISRIAYSPHGVKNQPVVSLTYGQLFDRNWNEVKNINLLVPSNDPSKNGGHDSFRIISFPYFLPIPFWHDIDNTDGNYFGPEDPRLILVRNKQGYEEPLLIFNSYHRKFVHYDDDEDSIMGQTVKFQRSMFMCWPWQYQMGKLNVEGTSNPEYDNKVYNRVIELKVKLLADMKSQKNWTPFISEDSTNKFDSYIYFVYRWANLDVLKCSLLGDVAGDCVFDYRLDETLVPQNKVGPLRGGTQLVNLRQVIPRSVYHRLLPSHREIFIGFARTHLDNCGCGKVMYRPNLVILVKDTADKTYYKISHISLSLSFDVPIIGWNVYKPDDLCFDSNVLIPYSVSNWNITSLELDIEGGRWVSNDQLTLTLSISDSTVHRLDIRGLFQSILDLADRSLFIPVDRETRVIDEFQNGLQNPGSNPLNQDVNLLGVNNDNIVCALDASVEFCFEYGAKFSIPKQDEFYEVEQQEFNEELIDPKKHQYFKILGKYLYDHGLVNS